MSGDGHIVRVLVGAGGDVAAAPGTEEGSPPLMEAASGGHAEAVRVLLAAGAPPDHPNKLGATALQGAAGSGHDLCVRALLEAGANPEGGGGGGGGGGARRDGGTTVLHACVCHSQVGAAPVEAYTRPLLSSS